MVMTVMLTDATAMMGEPDASNPAAIINVLVYADGALVVALQEARAVDIMICITQAGQQYGLSLMWKRGEALPVRCHVAISKFEL